MIEVVAMRPVHVAGAVALQRACFPPPFPEDQLWRSEHLERHLEIFPEGQFVALGGGEVVGSASAARVRRSVADAHLPWDQTLGGWFLEGHDPHGEVLYGADISVHPAWRGRGVGRALYAARFDLVRRLGLDRYATACRLPEFASSGLTSPSEFVEAVQAGERTDRTLTPLLRYGLSCLGVVEGYMDDEESGNAAALLEWRP